MFSFIGIGLILKGANTLGFHPAATWRGDLISLGGVISWSLYNVWFEQLLTRYAPLWLTALTMIIGTSFLLGTSVPMAKDQDWSAITWRGWSGLVYSGVFALIIGYVIWGTFVRRIGAARTAMYQNVVPAISIFISWIFLGERWELVQVVGVALVFAGLYLAGRRTTLSACDETRKDSCSC